MSRSPGNEQLAIAAPAGKLQSLLEFPRQSEPVGSVVVCHPHPLHGGTMDNKVAHTLSRAFLNCGFQSLRFNFRGVGQSEGEFDHGEGEVDDVVAVSTWLRRRSPELPLWLAGFSFGAAMAVRAALHLDPAGMVSIAPATSRFADSLPLQPCCPWLIVQGDEDELVPVDETVAWVNTLDPGPELLVFRQTEHFFHGKLVRLREAVGEFVRRTMSG
jgi:alpha/beta superfamily hydrolase